MTHFTKRDLMLGNQCRKAIWLQEHKPSLAAELDAAAKLRFEQGNLVDLKAREMYNGGELVSDTAWDAACNQTLALLEAGVTRLYQPAFSVLGLHIRADILDILPDHSLVLREVKMSTRLKDEHVLDIATQVFVLVQLGYTVKSAYLVAINNEFTPENDEALFHEVEVTKKVHDLAESLKPEVASITQSIDSDQEPDIQIGKHCTKPWTCPFYDHCWKDIPKASVLSIPRLSGKKLSQLQNNGILHLQDVPADFDLTANQWEYVHFQSKGTPAINKEAIKAELETFVYPLYFLDFETHSAPIPPYPRTYPYQQVPFQFSLHVLSHDGSLAHFDYLHTTDTDPRPQVVEHLLKRIGSSGTILTYNARFEIKVLEELMAECSSDAGALRHIISRVHDQLPLVKKNVQDPALYRSYSLKTVTRVLLNDDTYATLPISNGETAHACWVQLHALTNEQERQLIIENLKTYCHQDTLAQVHLHHWLEELAG